MYIKQINITIYLCIPFIVVQNFQIFILEALWLMRVLFYNRGLVLTCISCLLKRYVQVFKWTQNSPSLIVIEAIIISKARLPFEVCTRFSLYSIFHVTGHFNTQESIIVTLCTSYLDVITY